MKFEDLLMQQPSEEKPNLDDLQEEVEKLHQELDGEIKLKRVLQCALQGPVHSCPYSSSLMLPTKVKMLLTELKMVEGEIILLERKVGELNLNLCQEQRQTKERELHLIKEMQPAWEQRQWHKQKNRLDYGGHHRKSRTVQERRTSSSSSKDFQISSFRSSIEGVAQSSRYPRIYGNHIHIQLEDTDIIDIEKPNKLSEELIKCLTDIFLRLNQASYSYEMIKPPTIVPKHTRSTSKSKGFMSKSSFTSCTSPLFSWDDNSTSGGLDPYGILQDLDSTVTRDVGPYKNFLHITPTSIDTSLLMECRPNMRKLRVLMQDLRNVDLTYLTYKQKLAFWINMYNACIMHAFLQHGFPTAQEKVLAIMNEAAINVGGVLMNALAIEHFILRHPSESKQGPPDEKEMLLRHAYGLGYPEPNVIFALCKGCWSSPALRVYTADEIVNELETAKVEYLEASIGTTSKKNIILPKLMQWHMRDFADDMQSLLEWIYSQLPQSGSLKGWIMECLNGDTKSPVPNMIQIQPYAYEFRYILSL